MPGKSDVLSRKVILATVAIAALTSIGTEFGKTWLPSAASYAWNNITSSKLVFVTVLRDERLTPISKAVVKAVDPNPTRKTTFDEATTDDDGRAVLDKVRVQNFLLRVTYAEGGKLYTYLTDVAVDKWPHRMKIAEKNGWISHDIETSTGRLAVGVASTTPTVPTKDMPKWLEIALNEVGVKELPGPQGNPRIVEYHSSTSLAPEFRLQTIPWGCSFVSWVLEKANVQGNIKSARCADYLKFGTEIKEPRQGAITILQREGIPEANSGLAGFLVQADSRSVTLVVGNVDNQVAVVSFPKDRVRGFRWPSDS